MKIRKRRNAKTNKHLPNFTNRSFGEKFLDVKILRMEPELKTLHEQAPVSPRRLYEFLHLCIRACKGLLAQNVLAGPEYLFDPFVV